MKEFYKKHMRIINALILALVPITVCLLRALQAKRSLFDVWFCGSNWQDEVYYWQLTSDVIHYGTPRGYFGFNESSARLLSFSAWSPFLLIFWVIWGVVFGWTFLSPILCNIVVLSIALFLFAFFVRLDIKKTAVLGILLIVLSPISRFLMSCMAEISVISVLIVFIGLTLAMYKEYKTGYLVWSMILLALMTLMRPYLVLFALFSLVAIGKKKKIFIPCIVSVVSLVLYLLENKFFAPEYFDEYFRTEWITAFFTDGIGAGFSYIISSVKTFGSKILSLVWPGVRYGKDGIAAYYGVFVVFMLVYVVYSIVALIRKRKDSALIVSMAVLYIAMFAAIVLMYKVDEGYRHLLIFIVAGILIAAYTLEDITSYAAAAFFFVLISWVFIYKAKSNYFYHVSFGDEGTAMVEDIAGQMDRNMNLSAGVSWDNTVIWVSGDYIEETDEYSETLWRMLYGLPSGYALNICSAEYVSGNFDEIKSGYMATVPNGTIDKILVERNARLVAENEYFVMYDIREIRQDTNE